jgi:hypothetical protein
MALVEGLPVSSEGYGWYLPEDQTPVTERPFCCKIPRPAAQSNYCPINHLQHAGVGSNLCAVVLAAKQDVLAKLFWLSSQVVTASCIMLYTTAFCCSHLYIRGST